MTSVKADEAERFYEDDEDPREVFGIFDAAEMGHTAPPSENRPHRRRGRLRHEIANALRRRAANVIEPSNMRVRQATRTARVGAGVRMLVWLSLPLFGRLRPAWRGGTCKCVRRGCGDPRAVVRHRDQPPVRIAVGTSHVLGRHSRAGHRR
jgi:hypothetical protein